MHVQHRADAFERMFQRLSLQDLLEKLTPPAPHVVLELVKLDATGSTARKIPDKLGIWHPSAEHRLA